jgi:DNA-binding NarL/FixJ family response regulator
LKYRHTFAAGNLQLKNEQAMTRLVTFDPQVIFGFGIKTVVKTFPDFQVVGEATGVAGLLRILIRMPADIVLIGINVPDNKDDIDTACLLREMYPHVKILAVASEDTAPVVEAMRKAGINGYIGKRQADAAELEKAIRIVAAGGEYFGTIESSHSIVNSE